MRKIICHAALRILKETKNEISTFSAPGNEIWIRNENINLEEHKTKKNRVPWSSIFISFPWESQKLLDR